MLKKIISLLICSLWLLSVSAYADDTEWRSKPYKYLLIDQDLRDALAEFGHNLNVPIRIAETIGRIHIKGPFHLGEQATAYEFLQKLCDSYGLVWYFDGSILHISSIDDIDTEVLKIGKNKPEDILETLKSFELADARFTMRINEERGMLSISGPPAYRDLVKETLATALGLSSTRLARETQLNDVVGVRVFRGGS